MSGKVIVMTGTPGTGKTSLCRYIVKMNRGWVHLDLGRLAVKTGAILCYDPILKTRVVDMKALKKTLGECVSKAVEKGFNVLIDGHYAAEASPKKYVDYCIVLRCRPDVLWLRLRKLKKHSERKILMNVESEITDYCYLMAENCLEGKRIIQMDTTGRSVRELYARFMKCYRQGFRCEENMVDWVDFVSKHFENMEFLHY